MNDIYELISEVYDKCQTRIDAFKDKGNISELEYNTLYQIRFLQSQAADIILDYRRETEIRDKTTEGN